MKKLSQLICAVFISTQLLVPGVEAMELVLADQMCTTRSTADTKTVDYLYTVLDKYSSKLDNMAGMAKMTRLSAKALRVDYMNKLTTTSDELRYQDCPTEFSSKEDMMNGLREYIAALKFVINNKDSLTNLTNDVVADQGIVSLQNILLETYASLESMKNQMGQNNMFDLGFMFDTPFVVGDGKMNMNIQSDNDMQNNSFATKLGFNGSINLSEGGLSNTIDFQTKGLLDIRMIGKELFLGFNSLDIATQSQDQDIQEALKVLAIFKKVLGEKFIHITSHELVDGISPFEFNQQVVTKTLAGQPVLKFIYQEDGVHYGIMNPAFCDLLPEDQMMDCYLFNINLLAATNMKGFFRLQATQTENYELSITDKFMSQEKKAEAPEEIIYMLNKPLISWNPQELTSINIPLDKDGINKITYSNYRLDVKIMDSDTLFTLGGIIKKDIMDLTASVVNKVDNMEVMASLKMLPSSTQTKLVNAEVSISQSGRKMFGMTLQGTTESVPYRDIVKPTNIISADDFNTEMEKAVEAAGL